MASQVRNPGVKMLQLLMVSLLYSVHGFPLTSHLSQRHNSKLGTATTNAPETTKAPVAALKQLQIKFNCDDVDTEDLSDVLFELGTLSVSVEVKSEREDFLNDEKTWKELGKQKSWQTAELKANFPKSFDYVALKSLVTSIFPEARLEMEVVDLEDRGKCFFLVTSPSNPHLYTHYSVYRGEGFLYRLPRTLTSTSSLLAFL